MNKHGIQNGELGVLINTLRRYMLLLEDDNVCRIEVHYHDASRKKFEMMNTIRCNFGSFSGPNTVTGNSSKIVFTSGAVLWEKNISAQIVGVTEKVVVVISGGLRVFKHDGIEALNCLLVGIREMCCYGNTIALFSNDLTIINLFEKTERYPLPGPVD